MPAFIVATRRKTMPAALFALMFCAGSALAADVRVPEPKIPFDPRFYVCYRAQKPLEMDGRLDEASWKKADWTESFVDIEGEGKPKPRFRTRVKMLWDDRYFYVAAELEEPDVWATYRDRDSVIFEENCFEVFIDPDGDTHDYYELEINALNTIWDLLLNQPYRDGETAAVNAWDMRGLKSAIAVNGTLNVPRDKDKGWLVEMALPWDVLRECAPGNKPHPDAGDQWRMNFSRVEYRLAVENGAYVKALDPASGKPSLEDNWVWSPQGLINIHYPEMWGFVEFTDKVVGKGKELFSDAFEEPVKWALRRIYYRELAYRDADGAFATELGDLGLAGDKSVRLDGWSYPPSIRITDSLFEAVYRNDDGESWHIRQDGLVWKEASAGGERR
jgi:hypothetical protein